MSTAHFRWRGRVLSVPTSPETSMFDIRASLADQTDVPAERQTLLLAGRRTRPGDAELASAVLPPLGAPPVAMLGTPRAVAAAQVAAALVAAAAEAVTDDDEGEPVGPPPAPPVPAAWMRPAGSGGGFAGVPFAALGSAEDVVSVETVEDVEGDGQGLGQTNGAALRLEEVDEMLGGSVCGEEFVERFGTGELNVMPEQRFLKAVSRSKADLKMLAVLLLDMGSGGDDVGTGSDSDGGEAAAASAELFRETLQAPIAADLLNGEFVMFAADVSPLTDGGRGLLRRLGLHALPAVLLLSDVGSGVVVVDMFAGAYYAGLGAAGQVAARLRETQAVFEFGYEAARARRVVSEDRHEIIGEQDAEFAASAAADRARGEALAEDARRAAEALRETEAEVEAARGRLPPPPKIGGARLAVRLPDGRRVDRRFAEETKVRDLFDWCVTLGVKGGSFALSVSFPRRTLSLEEHGTCSLEAAGLMPTAALMVDIL